MRRIKLLVPLALAAFAAAVAIPIASGGSHPTPTFGALHRAARAHDELPPNSGSGPLARVNPRTARLVGTADGADVYMAAGPEDSVCVLADVDGGLTGDCTPREAMTDTPAYVAWRTGNASDVTVAVLAPDAYDRAEIDGREIPVHDNLALTHAPAGEHSRVELSGDQGTITGELNLSNQD